jgi:hypothetical protein
MTFIIARYNERLLTILTSNYEDNPDLEVPDSFKVRVGARMPPYSRDVRVCRIRRRRLPAPPPNGGVDDLMALWKVAGEQKAKLPSRAKGPVRAQLRPSSGKRDLGWPGGRAGS